MGNEELNLMLEKLTKLRDQLIKLNEKTGALERARSMREEILKVGWKGIMEKYHPDVNTQDPAANELFKMYKYVYEDMKKKLMDM
ncbi:MAG TPA: hypothetical protein PK566_07730 [Pseudobacteroides sp.]|nr:hypothetical protein [Pseudobacteroides sp.]